MRVISLIASSTEIIHRLGFGGRLVGRSHECDYPEEVRHLPACSRPKFLTEGTSREIHSRVESLVRDALSLYEVDTARLRELRPDVIVTQDHCEVCAVGLRDVEEAVCRWLDARPRIVALRPNALADVWRGMEEVAAALGDRARGTRLAAECRERMQAVMRRVKTAGPAPSVACIEWIDPLMAAGNWVPELCAMLGARCLFGAAGKHSPWMSFEDLCAADPEVIVFMPCGWDIARTSKEVPLLAARPEWPALRAVKAGRVYLADGNSYFNRPGPRLAESLEVLAEVLFPGALDYGHSGYGWQRLLNPAAVCTDI
jgi:iron complex transport system substrate-binding protein